MTTRTVSVRLQAEVAGYIAGMKQAAASTKAIGAEAVTAAEKNGAAMTDLGVTLSATGLSMTGLFAASVSKAAEFDKAISGVGAVSNATAGQMKELHDAALAAGQATVFGATDAANAEAELAKAGVSVKDILGGGLSGALNLAAAGQLDVADAAEIAATAMTQFGLSGSDVPHIADLLAAGANKAQGSVGDLGTALKYVGPVAHQMGISIEQTTGTIAELASNGIIADQAGTSLRGMLASLTSPSKKAAETMGQLGINVYDASGNFVGFNGVAGQLQERLGGLTNAQRDAALGAIFGNEQITAARVLYAGGAEAVDDWTNKVNDSGSAQRIAGEMTNNLAGDLEQLKGAIENSLIKTGEAATPVLRSLTKAATEAVSGYSNLSGPAHLAAAGILGVGGAATLASGAFLVLAPRIVETRAALQTLSTTAPRAAAGIGMLARAGAVGVVLGGVTLGAQALGDKINNIADPAVSKLTLSLVDLAKSDDKNGYFGHGIKSAKELSDAVNVIASRGTFEKLGSFASGLSPAARLFGSDDEYRSAKKNVEGLDKALTSLVAGGNADAAAVAVGKLGISSGEVNKALPKYVSALAEAEAQQKLAATSGNALGTALGDVAATAENTIRGVDGYATAILDANGAVTEQSKDLRKLKDDLDDLNGVHLTLRDAQRGFEQAIDDATAALKENHKTLDIGTEKGRANSAALDAIAEAANAQAKAMDEANASATDLSGFMGGAREKLIAAAKAFGMLPPAAEAYANSVLQIPETVTTEAKLQADKAKADAIAAKQAIEAAAGGTVTSVLSINKDQAGRDLRDFHGDLAKVAAETPTTKIFADPSSANNTLRDLHGSLGVMDNTTATPHLTADKSVADSQLFVLNRDLTGLDGRIVTADAYVNTSPAEQALAQLGFRLQQFPRSLVIEVAAQTSTAVSVIQGTANKLRAGRYADGGWVSGPGGPRDDMIPARLSHGEFVVNAASARANATLLEALNAGRRYANGGWVSHGSYASTASARPSAGVELPTVQIGQIVTTDDARSIANAIARKQKDLQTVHGFRRRR